MESKIHLIANLQVRLNFPFVLSFTQLYWAPATVLSAAHFLSLSSSRATCHGLCEAPCSSYSVSQLIFLFVLLFRGEAVQLIP